MTYGKFITIKYITINTGEERDMYLGSQNIMVWQASNTIYLTRIIFNSLLPEYQNNLF